MPKKMDDKVLAKVEASILKLAKRKDGVTPKEIEGLPGTDYVKGKVFGALKKSSLEARRCNKKDARKVSYHVTAKAAA